MYDFGILNMKISQEVLCECSLRWSSVRCDGSAIFFHCGCCAQNSPTTEPPFPEDSAGGKRVLKISRFAFALYLLASVSLLMYLQSFFVLFLVQTLQTAEAANVLNSDLAADRQVSVCAHKCFDEACIYHYDNQKLPELVHLC